MNSASEEIKGLAEAIGVITRRREEELEKARVEAFRAGVEIFFKNNPTVKAINWTQWTPHFNDGEPCRFSKHDVHPIMEIPEEDGDWGRNWEQYFNSYVLPENKIKYDQIVNGTEYSWTEAEKLETQWPGCTKQTEEDFDALCDLFHRLGEDFFERFGDGVRVILYNGKDEVETREVDHD